MLRRLRVLIADDNAKWRNMILQLVQSECDVVGHVDRGDEILPEAVRLQPDVVTIDVSMPGQSGLKALPQVRDVLPEAVLIVVSATESRLYRDEAFNRGADDYVAKRCIASELLSAIRRGRQGRKQNKRFA